MVKSILNNKHKEGGGIRRGMMNLLGVSLEVCFMVFALQVNSSLQHHGEGKIELSEKTKQNLSYS